MRILETLGPTSDPQEVRDLRMSSIEFHQTLGEPVIWKHKWNETDLREGRAQRCPFHDDTYGRRDSDFDEYCFGTGYLGGWDDGILVNVSIGDTQEDVFRLTDAGVLMRDMHPEMTAPWNPLMGDGDILIRVEIDENLEPVNYYERYMIEEVTPITVRGPGYRPQKSGKRFIVNQTAALDRLPTTSPLYNVPIFFDYDNIPVVVDPNVDPDVYPPGTQFSATERSFRVIGIQREFEHKTSDEADVRVAVAGVASATSFGINVVGDPEGTHVYLD